MRFFFRSKKFKIMLSVTACILVVTLIALIIGNPFSPQNGVIGAVTASVQETAAKVSNWFSDINKKINDGNSLMLENSSLKSQINELNSQLTDYEKTKQENELYEKYLGIKEEHTDYIMEPAMLISRNADDPYASFIINKGSLQGISKYDPVITEEGLIGYISEVNPSFSKVTTVLDSTLSCGSIDSRTRDAGIISGELALAEKGKTRMSNLLRSSGVAAGDFLVTSGGGVFPEGIIIGTVDSVHNESYNTSLYAVVSPIIDFNELRDMMVITYFSGQGNSSGETK